MLCFKAGQRTAQEKRNEMKKKTRRFKGWDWSELGQHWGVYGSKDEAASLAAMQNLMLDACAKGGASLKEVAGDVRAFLKKLSRCDCYLAPAWVGMLNMKKDEGGNETLLRFAVNNLEYMWN